MYMNKRRPVLKSLINPISSAYEQKKPFECFMCPSKFVLEDHLNKDIAAVHEKKIHELDVTCQSKTYGNRNTNEKLKSFKIFLK